MDIAVKNCLKDSASALFSFMGFRSQGFKKKTNPRNI